MRSLLITVKIMKNEITPTGPKYVVLKTKILSRGSNILKSICNVHLLPHQKSCPYQLFKWPENQDIFKYCLTVFGDIISQAPALCDINNDEQLTIQCKLNICIGSMGIKQLHLPLMCLPLSTSVL